MIPGKTFTIFVHRSLFNSVLAARHIGFSGKTLVKTADAFMAQYPRGKGTKGNEILQDFYAACYTIKLEQHRSRDHKRAYHIVNVLTDAQCNYLLLLPETGEWLEGKIGNTKTTNALLDKGLINGFVDGRGTYTKQCLTDDGLRIIKLVKARVLSAKFEAAANIARDDLEMVQIAVSKIVNFNRNDPEAFIENAKSVMAKLSG